MYYVLCCTLLYKYFTQRITVHKELNRRLSKIIEGYLFKKPIYMWKSFPGLVCFYTLIRAKLWLLGKSETTWNPHLISLQFSFLVLNGIRVEIGPGDRFWNSGLLVTIPVFAWVADLSENTLQWDGEAELRVSETRTGATGAVPRRSPWFLLFPLAFQYCAHLSANRKEGQVGVVEAHGGTPTKKKVEGKMWRIK